MLRSVTSALAALALLAPAAAAAEPWSAPAPVPGAPDTFPSLAFPSSGRGDVLWNAVTDDPAGQIAGAVTSAAGAEPARVLREGMIFNAVDAYGRDRLVAGGQIMVSEAARAAVAFGSASGALGEPRRLAAGGAASTVRALDANAAGDVAVVTSTCVRRTCGTRSLALFVRRAGSATFRRVASLAQPSTQVRAAAVAVNARGDVVAAWENRHRIYTRTRTAGGRLTDVEPVGPGVQASIAVALSPVRRTVVAWSSQRVSEGEALTPFTAYAAYRGPTDRRFHTFREVGSVPRTGTGRYVAGRGVAVSLTGTRTTVVTTTATGERYAVAARDIDGSGRPLPAQQLSPPGVDAILGDVATGPAGEQVALFVTGRAGADLPPGGTAGLGASVRPAGAAAFGAPETVVAGASYVDTVTAAVDPVSRRTFAAWRLPGQPVQLASRAPVG